MTVHTPIEPILVINTSPILGFTLYFSKSSLDIYFLVSYGDLIFSTLINFTPCSVYFGVVCVPSYIAQILLSFTYGTPSGHNSAINSSNLLIRPPQFLQ